MLTLVLMALNTIAGALSAGEAPEAGGPSTAAAEPAVRLTPPTAPTPRIKGATVFGVRPGAPFLFTIAASGERPMTFAAENLPDMKALTDYIHAKGLKAGIYSSPGKLTCARFEASYQHEEQDVKQFAEWGFDFLKYDWCSYGKIVPKSTIEQREAAYELISGLLKKQTRDIVLNLCQYGHGSPAGGLRSRGTSRSDRDLENGGTAVGIFNRGDHPAPGTISWAEIGVTGQQKVRDLRRQKDLGEMDDQYETVVPRHGVVFVRIGEPIPDQLLPAK